MGSGTGGVGSGAPQFQTFDVVKIMDKASSDLFLACCSGKEFATVEIHLCDTYQEEQRIYWKGEMEDCRIASYMANHAGAGMDKPTEALCLAYRTFKSTYFDIEGAEYARGWNLKENKKLD